MQLRNTPDPDCDISPAKIVFGRQLRNAFGFVNRLDKLCNDNVTPMWRDTWKQKESSLHNRFHHTAKKLAQHSRCYLLWR